MARDIVGLVTREASYSVTTGNLLKLRAPKPGQIVKFMIYSHVAPSGSAAHFDLKVNGVSVLGGTPLALAAGSNSASVTLAVAVTTHDLVVVDLLDTPSAIGDDLTIYVDIEETDANLSDTDLLDRTNHTGAQAAATISDFAEAAQDSVGTILDDSGDVDFTYDDATPKITGAIKSDAVSYAKMQNVSAASKLLGRGDSGAGDPQEITIGSGLAMTGTTLSTSGSGYTDEQAQDAVGSILDDSGDVDFTYDDATPKITGAIKSDAVSYAKMQNVSAASKLLGRGDSGSGDPQEITLGTGLSMTGTTLSASGGGGGGITELTGDVVAATGGGSGSQAAVVKSASADFAFSGTVSPTSLSADQNDYNPTSLSAANALRLTSSVSVTITGLAGGAAGRTIFVMNIGSKNITLAHNSGSSSAGNKFLCANSTDVTMLPGASVILWWDTTSNAWRVTASVKKLVNSDVTWPPAPANPNADDEEFDGDFSAWTDVGIDTTHAKKAISGSLAQIECVAANSDFRGIYKAISGSTFRIQAGPFRYTGPQAGAPEYDFGLYLRETSTSKGLMVGPRCNSTTGGFTGTQLMSTRFAGQSWSSAGSLFAPWNQWDWVWIEAELTSTNVIIRISNDGVFFRQILSESKTASFTTAPNAIGLGFYAESQAFFFTVDYIRRLA